MKKLGAFFIIIGLLIVPVSVIVAVNETKADSAFYFKRVSEGHVPIHGPEATSPLPGIIVGAVLFGFGTALRMLFLMVTFHLASAWRGMRPVSPGVRLASLDLRLDATPGQASARQ